MYSALRVQKSIKAAVLPLNKYVFIAGMLCYCLMGMLTLYSASNWYAATNFGDAAYFVKRQIFFIFLGLVIFGALQKFSVEWLARLKIRWLAVACLCLAVYVNLAGFSRHGVRGWFYLLDIPFRVGDILTLLLILAMVKAYFYDQAKFHGRHFGKLVLMIQLSAWILPYHFPDRGVFAMIVMVSSFVLLVLSRYTALAAMSGFYLLLLLGGLFFSQSLVKWLNAIRDALLLIRPTDLSYQFVQSIANLSAGGFWGRWDYWTVEAGQFLPEAHLGFIFSNFVRHAGLAGTILLLAFWLVLLVNVIKSLQKQNLNYSSFLTFTFCGLFFSWCLIGMLTAVGMFPANNIGIPVFSLQPMHTLEAFVTFGLLYKQLGADAACTKQEWKVRLTEPIILLYVGVFSIVILKISYHMIKEFT